MTVGLLTLCGYLSRKTTTWRRGKILSSLKAHSHHMNRLFGKGPSAGPSPRSNPLNCRTYDQTEEAPL
jgi:hypothetical protein